MEKPISNINSGISHKVFWSIVGALFLITASLFTTLWGKLDTASIERVTIAGRIDVLDEKIPSEGKIVNKEVYKNFVKTINDKFDSISKWQVENDRLIENRDTVQCMTLRELQRNIGQYDKLIECGLGAGGF